MDFVIQHKLIQHDKAIILQFKKKETETFTWEKRSLNQFQEKQTNKIICIFQHVSIYIECCIKKNFMKGIEV